MGLSDWLARAWRLLLVAVVVVVILGLGLRLWMSAGNGTKQAELGTGLISSMVVGVALLLVQRSFSQAADRRQARAATGLPPEEDTYPGGGAEPGGTSRHTEPTSPGPVVSETELPQSLPPAVEAGHHYRVEYEGTIRDTSRVDALQVRLRVFIDDDRYLQFITVPVPAPELRGYVGLDATVPPGQLWHAIALAACPLIEDAIRRREVPLTTPTKGYEVQFDIGPAVRKARRGELPDIEVDQTVCEFDV